MDTTTLTLPALPKLERAQLRRESVEADGCGTLEALVPAAEEYRCDDPHAPVLVLIAGMGVDGTGLIRQLQVGKLAHIYLFNMPNDPVPGEVELGGFARHVEEFILRKGLDARPGGLVLGGHSMGGATTLLMAVRARVKLRAIVLLGTFANARHLPLIQRVAAPLAWVVPMNIGHVVACRMGGLLRLFKQPYADWKWMAHPIIWRTHGYYGRAVRALTRLNLIEDARKITLPALIVHGRKDSVLRYAAAEEMAATLPNARLVTLDDAGHNLCFTHAEKVNGALAEFLISL
jgi:pimeloyl-ACP methyl ester carboxylesterase